MRRTLRRTTRDVLGVAPYMAEPRLYPKCLVVQTYWWDWHPNFGDELARLVLPMYGIVPIRARLESADLFAVGSVLDVVPKGFNGWIWGSGQMHPDRARSLPDARVLAVRGALTRDLLALPEDIALGDPGLLVAKRVPRAPQTGRIAVVPHFSHQHSREVIELRQRLGSDAYVVDVTEPASRVVRHITGARAVVSTSLHGVVIADAYAIPAVWASTQPELGGGDFKFRDYESVVLPHGGARKVDLSALHTARDVLDTATIADQAAAARSISDLEFALARLTNELPQRRVSPLSLVGEQLRR